MPALWCAGYRLASSSPIGKRIDLLLFCRGGIRRCSAGSRSHSGCPEAIGAGKVPTFAAVTDGIFGPPVVAGSAHRDHRPLTPACAVPLPRANRSHLRAQRFHSSRISVVLFASLEAAFPGGRAPWGLDLRASPARQKWYARPE